MKEADTRLHREEKAVQALVSAALHVSSAEVSLEEIQPYLTGEVVLSAEDEAALKQKRVKTFVSAPPTLAPQEEAADAEAFMALHRKKPEHGFAAKTEEEIRRKREELLEKLRKKKGAG